MERKQIGRITGIITGIWLVLLLGGVPLITDGTYMEIATVKWNFYRAITLGFRAGRIVIPGLLFVLFLLFVWTNENKAKLLKVCGWWGILYVLDVCISVLFAADKTTALSGFPGWYMGLYAQISFVMIYYLISSMRIPLKPVCVFMGVTSSFIYILEVLNRFGIYPPGMLGGLEEGQIKLMVSTIGNINWFAGYMACVLPLCLMAYVRTSGRNHIFAGVWVLLSALTMATLNSESIAASFFVLILILLVMYRNRYAELRRVLEIILITASAWLLFGMLYRSFPDRTVPMDKICNLMMHPLIDLALIGGSLVLYLVSGELIRRNIQWDIKLWVCIAAMLGVSAIAAVILYYDDHSYLHFDDFWGNHRGLIWRITRESWARIWREAPLKALFGCGPDQYYLEVTGHYTDLLETIYHGQLLTNAHNEFLTSLIHFGLAGTVCYCGMLVHCIRSFAVRHRTQPELTAGALLVISYIANNFFSFQQIVSTPILFGLAGVFLSNLADVSSATDSDTRKG